MPREAQASADRVAAVCHEKFIHSPAAEVGVAKAEKVARAMQCRIKEDVLFPLAVPHTLDIDHHELPTSDVVCPVAERLHGCSVILEVHVAVVAIELAELTSLDVTFKIEHLH